MNKQEFQAIEKQLSDTGYRVLPQSIRFGIKDARRLLYEGLCCCCENAKWLKEYDNISEWLQDNNGKGLSLIGGCGVGKTLIGAHIIPVLLNAYCRKIVNVFSANDMNTKTNEVLAKPIVYIDDVGVEFTKNEYGNKREVFSEIVDCAEKEGKILMFSTNLTTDKLKERYGDRTFDRLRAITKCIIINEPKSLRA